MTTRRLLAALVLAGLSFTACGRGGGSADPTIEASTDTTASRPPDTPPPAGPADLRALVLASAANAAQATTAHFEYRMTMPGSDGTPVEMVGTGAVDTSVPVMTMEMDLGALGGAVPELGRDAKMLAVYDGKAFYFRYPEPISSMLGGKPWLRMDLDALSDAAGLDLDALMSQMQGADPLGNVSLLAGAADDVTDLGEEVVAGVSTRHYRLTVDIRRSLEQSAELFDGPNAERIRTALSAVAGMMKVDTLPVEVWIDADGLPRRIQYSMNLSDFELPDASAPGLAGAISIRMDVTAYGTPVTWSIPPASETTDFAQLMQQQLGG